ncbi:thioredoxin-like protein [Sodiomyces alkalinus F11]|uniref:Thioredoxin-like protein n=1 Tax=Sodiomyces alkalinus (strain CBS 110278 / VKM F-3762 / F11) TaxID=1314773 RepID=A0A3N2PUK2_SODAK|nr:thioredoxin-like protein [Sodiomyces alkalinus F11]ROT38195.1 thioredoxin-like protein [Sodiomyces alkalinus F11]
MSSSPEIILYTNHRCPWAHRAHIALAELNIPFKEEIVDLDKPRTEAYLKINPRGLVPSLSYDGEIIAESAIVAQFLADAHPSSHLLPPSNTAEGAVRRARVNFFTDAFFSKVHPAYFKSVTAKTDEEVEEAGRATVDAVVKEIEPLLADAAPYFGGSEKPTLAEVLTGSWLIRLFTFAKYGYLPKTLTTELSERAPNFTKWADAVVKTPSVNAIYDEENFVRVLEERTGKTRSS